VGARGGEKNEMSIPNSRRPTHGGITTTPGVNEKQLSSSRKLTHGCIPAISGVEERPLSDPAKKTESRQYNQYI
jgi:hypothetical protein